MCTSIITNRSKTLIGWNLDILGMQHRVREAREGVYIEILDEKEGWLPLFGANARLEFVAMPTCHPFDARSNPGENSLNLLMLDIDLLLQKKSFTETVEAAMTQPVASLPGVSFMSQLSDADGNVLQIIPGQGTRFFEKPRELVLTNFSPYKMDSETHPWMGWDRYQTAMRLLSEAPEKLDVPDLFSILEACSQEVCPTVVSMVLDPAGRTVYWCENRQYDKLHQHVFSA